MARVCFGRGIDHAHAGWPGSSGAVSPGRQTEARPLHPTRSMCHSFVMDLRATSPRAIILKRDPSGRPGLSLSSSARAVCLLLWSEFSFNEDHSSRHAPTTLSLLSLRTTGQTIDALFFRKIHFISRLYFCFHFCIPVLGFHIIILHFPFL